MTACRSEMTNNYFKVMGRGRTDEYFFFDSSQQGSVVSAFQMATNAARPYQHSSLRTKTEEIVVYRVPNYRGMWSSVSVIGDDI